MRWIGDNWGNLLSALGLLAGIISIIQSTRAVTKAEEAVEAAKESSRRSEESMEIGKLQAVAATVQSELALVDRLGSELETLMRLSSYEAASVRCRDLSKQTSHIIQRWDDAIPKTSLVVLVATVEQIEDLALKLERGSTISAAEHRRLLSLVRRILQAITKESILAQKVGINA